MTRIASLFFALALLPAARAELAIVSAEHRDANSFKRISEYLTGEPSEGRYEIVRTQPDRRDGFYVSLIAKDRSQLASVSSVRLHFVPPGTQEVETVDMPAGELRKKRLLVGLTDERWATPDTFPLAWKIELLDAEGARIDSAQSFLWAEPL